VALNGGRLTNGWNSNLDKQVSAHELSLETDRHPPGIHLFSDKWLINRFFIKQTESRRGVSILRRWKPDFNGSRKPVFHPTNGREGETATLFLRCPLNSNGLGGGFAPRQLNRSLPLGFPETCC
jgi:hypothetical protein